MRREGPRPVPYDSRGHLIPKAARIPGGADNPVASPASQALQPCYHVTMETQAITIRLPVEIYERLRREAYETRTSQVSIIVRALEERYREPAQPEQGATTHG